MWHICNPNIPCGGPLALDLTSLDMSIAEKWQKVYFNGIASQTGVEKTTSSFILAAFFFTKDAKEERGGAGLGRKKNGGKDHTTQLRTAGAGRRVKKATHMRIERE